MAMRIFGKSVAWVVVPGGVLEYAGNGGRGFCVGECDMRVVVD